MNIVELSESTGVTPRNIKRYIQMRLLGPPDGKTRSARYSEGHRRELLRIESLRGAGLSWAQIRTELSSHLTLTDDVVVSAESLFNRPYIEHRYEIADGIYVVFSSAGSPRRVHAEVEMTKRFRRAVQDT